MNRRIGVIQSALLASVLMIGFATAAGPSNPTTQPESATSQPEASHPYVGLLALPSTEITDRSGLPDEARTAWVAMKLPPGMLLVQFGPQSPAASSGLLVGDLILAINGKGTANLRGWEAATETLRVDADATIVVLRRQARKVTRHVIKCPVVGLDNDQHEAIRLLSRLSLRRDPAVGRTFVSTSVQSDLDAGRKAALSLSVYLAIDEQGKVSVRCRPTYIATEWLFIDSLMFRADGKEQKFRLADVNRQVDMPIIRETADMELTEDDLHAVATAKEAYVTVFGEHSRFSFQLNASQQEELSRLLAYAALVARVGAVKAMALPPAEPNP